MKECNRPYCYAGEPHTHQLDECTTNKLIYLEADVVRLENMLKVAKSTLIEALKFGRNTLEPKIDGLEMDKRLVNALLIIEARIEINHLNLLEAVAKEREACAKIAEITVGHGCDCVKGFREIVALEIRGRK